MFTLNKEKTMRNIKYARKDKCITQEKAAKLLHVNIHTVARWENVTVPPFEVILELANLYNVNWQQLLVVEDK